jgi:hypothetical protein
VFLADRAFIGTSWFIALQKQKIPYVIRIRNNQFVTLPDAVRIKISALAKRLIPQKPQTWPEAGLDGVRCSLSLKRLPDGELLAVVAHGLKRSDDPLEIYRQRWGIELCFACLKTKGFSIEDTHLRHAGRLEKIFALASIAAAAALRASVEQPDKPARKASSRKKPRLRRPFGFSPRSDFSAALPAHPAAKSPISIQNCCRAEWSRGKSQVSR